MLVTLSSLFVFIQKNVLLKIASLPRESGVCCHPEKAAAGLMSPCDSVTGTLREQTHECFENNL